MSKILIRVKNQETGELIGYVRVSKNISTTCTRLKNCIKDHKGWRHISPLTLSSPSVKACISGEPRGIMFWNRPPKGISRSLEPDVIDVGIYKVNAY